MNTMTRIAFLGCTLLLAACSPQPLVVALQMDRKEVEAVLASMHCVDTGDGMQIDGKAPKGWMWASDPYDVSIETFYDKEGKLTAFHIWDWQGRKLTSYHHTMEFLDIRRASFRLPPKKHEFDVIRVENPGKR